MVRIIKVSRSGLARCPSCAQHIQVAAELGDTVCPFCEASVRMVPDEPIAGPLKAATRMLMTGRSSLIAASLFGASAMMGCPSDDGSSGSADVSEDTAVDTAEDAQLDIPNAAAYGLPPEPDTTQLEDVASDTMEEDVGPVDLYGAPPMEDVEEDTAADAEPMPEYGAPPMEDVAEDTAPDPEPQPEYGAPPMDEDTSDPE